MFGWNRPIEITINIPPDPRIDRILRAVHRLTHQGEETMADLSELRSAVAENTSVTDSVEVLVRNLADQLEAAGSQEEIDAIVADLRNNSGDLSTLVTQNTPAEGGNGGGGDVPPDDGGDVPVDDGSEPV